MAEVPPWRNETEERGKGCSARRPMTCRIPCGDWGGDGGPGVSGGFCFGQRHEGTG